MDTRVRVAISSERQEYTAKDKLKLTFSLTNDSDQPISLLKWNTPLEGFSNDILNVKTKGKRVVYLGKIVKRGPPTAADYASIAAGASVSADFDLAEVYDIYEQGEFSVEFNADMLSSHAIGYEKEVAARKAVSPKNVYRSETLRFKLVEPRQPVTSGGVRLDWMPSMPKVPADAVGKQPASFVGCTQAQKDTINQALSNAENLSWKSKLQLKHLRQLVVVDELLWASRFWTWFGGCGDSIQAYMGRYDKITNDYLMIHDAFANKSITFDASDHSNVYAYVYPTKPYVIYLCNLFWSAPALGTDSQAGTLIHEMSHFNVVAGTKDNVYGQAGSMQLAINNPSQAINNADSHEYFAEDTPFVPLGHNGFVFAHIRANNGQYMVAEGAGGGAVNANRPVASIWESFAIIDINSGDLNSGDVVHLLTYDGAHYVVAENGGGGVVKADRTWSREWETYRIIRSAGPGKINNGDTVNLQAYNSNYVCAEGGGGGVVTASRTAASAWETFKVEFI